MCVMALVSRKTTTASTNASPSHRNVVGDDADPSTLKSSTAKDTTLSSSCHSSPYRSATRGVLLRLQHARREAQGQQQHADSSNKTSSSNTTTKDGRTTTTTTTEGCMTASSPVLTEPTRQPASRPRSIRRTTTTIRQSESGSESRTHAVEQLQPQCSALSAPSSLASTLNSISAVHTIITITNDKDIGSSSKGRKSGARDGAVTAAAVTTRATPTASTTTKSSSSKRVGAATVGNVRHDEKVDQSQGSRCSRDRPSPMVVLQQQDTRTHNHLPRYTHKSDEDEKQKNKSSRQAVVAAAEEDATVQRDDIMTSCKATTAATTAVVDEADVVVMHAQPHSVRDTDTTDMATRYSATRCAVQTANQTSHSAAATRLASSGSLHYLHHGCAEDHAGGSACHATSSHHTLPVTTTTATSTSSDATAVDMSHRHAMSVQRDKSIEQGTPHSVSPMTREVNELLRTRTTAVAEDLVAGEKNTTCSSSSCVAAPVMSDDGDRDTASGHTTLHTNSSSGSSKKEVQGSAVHDTAYEGSGALSELRMAHTPDTVALPCHSPHLASHSSSQQQQQLQPTSHLTHTVTTTTGNDDVAVSQPPSAHHSPHCLSSLDRWRAAQHTQTHKNITTTTTTISDEERKEEDNVLLVLPSSATPHTPLPCPLTAASSSPSTSHASFTTTTAAKTTLSDSVRQPRHLAMLHAERESTACDVLHPSLASPCLQRTPGPTHIDTTTTSMNTPGDGVNEGVVHSSLERWRRTQAAAGVTTTTATATNGGRSSVAIQSSRASQQASARQPSSMPTSPHPPACHSSSSRIGRVRLHDSAEAVVLHSSAEGCRSESNAFVSQDNDYACNTAQDVKAVHAECITSTKEEQQPIQGETRDDMKEHGSEGEERVKETHGVSASHTPSAVGPHVNVTSLPASVLVYDTSHTNINVLTSQAETASSPLVPHAVHANDRTPHKAVIEQSRSYYSNDNKEGGDVKQVGNVRLDMTVLAQQTTYLTHMDNHNDNMHNSMAKVETGVGHVLQQASHVAHERESPQLPSHTTTTTTSITDTHSPSPPPHSTTNTHSDMPCDGRRDTVKNKNNSAAAVVKGDGSSSVSAQSPSLPSTSVASVAGASAAAMPKSQYVHDLQAFITRLEQQLSRASFAEAADTATAPQHTSPKYEEGNSSTNTKGHEEEHVVCRKSTLYGDSSSIDDAIAARGQHLTVPDMKAVKDAACVGMHGSVAAHVSSLSRHHPATYSVVQPERTSGSIKDSIASDAAVIEPRNTVSTTTTSTAAMPESKTHIVQQQSHAPRAAVRTMTTGSAAVPALATVVADGEAKRARSHTDTNAEDTTHTTTTTTSYSAAAADMDSVTSETDEDVPFWCDRLLLYDDEEEGECRGQSRPAHTTASPCSSNSASVPEAVRRVPRLDLSALYIPDDAFLAERYRIPMPTCETRPDEARLRLWHEVGIASASRNNSAGIAVVSEDSTSVVCAKPQHRHHNNNNNKRAVAVEAVVNEAVACVEEKKDGEVHTAVHAMTTSVVEAGSIMERLRQHRAQREQRRLAAVVAEGNTMKSEDVSGVKKKEDVAAGQTMTSSIAAENEKACAELHTPPPPPLRASQQQRDEEDTRRGGRNVTGTRTTAPVVATSVVQLEDKTPPHGTTTTTTSDDVGVAERTSITLHQADRDHSTCYAALLSHHTIHDTTDSPLPRATTTTLSLHMKAEGDKGQQNEADSHVAGAVQTREDDNNDGGVATAPHRMSSSHTNHTAHTDSNNNSGRGTTWQLHNYVHSKDGFESELSGHYGHHFSDASDALDGGRGVEQERRTRMRSLRVQLLLLTCQEQRGRKSIWAEEAMRIERMCRYAFDSSGQRDNCSSMSAVSLRVTLSP